MKRSCFALIVVLALASLGLLGCGKGEGRTHASGEPPSSTISDLGKVAYELDREIYVKSLPDGEPQRLVEGTKPHWSADGEWLLFQRDGVQWELREDGSGEQQVAEKRDGTSLSPDGTHQAYVETVQDASRPLGRYDRLHIADANGDDDAVLYEFDGGIVLEGWTADSKYVLFWEDWQFSASLMADGTNLEAVPASGGPIQSLYRGLARQGMISPAPNKSETLAVVEGGGRESWTDNHISLVDVGEGKVTPLTSSDVAALEPAWSPDGGRIAFVSQPDSHFPGENGTIPELSHDRRIWVMNADGSGQHPLTSDPAYRDERPLWSSDGSQVLFVRLDKDMHTSLWLVSSDGGDAKQVVDALGPTGANGYYGDSDTLDYYGVIDWGGLFDWWQGSF